MSSSGNTPVSAHKHARVLACVLCQHRKIKCDRNTPCSNCIKANVTCTPSVPAPARKRRRPNQDLQERLARCEKLLQQYSAAGSPPASSAGVTDSPSTASTQIKQDTDASTPDCQHDSDSWKKRGKIIKEEGGMTFMSSEIWATLSEELQGMRTLMDEDQEETSVLSPEDASPEDQTDLLLSGDMARTSIEDVLPEPVHIYRLWQVYLDRVNPLTKIIHVPTVQPYIVEMASNPNAVAQDYQALLYAIFSMATVALTQIECMQLLGVSKDKALQDFNGATKATLARLNYLKNYSMPALQALALFMQSIESRCNRHAAWVISGVVVRIAVKMGYHRDGEHLKLSSFETEMRRRIWWHIIMYDDRLAHHSGLNNSFATLRWDTKAPMNINDADLFPGAKEAIQPREGPTEMIFCLLVYECFKWSDKMDRTTDDGAFEAALLGSDLEDNDQSEEERTALLQKVGALTRELLQNLADIESKYSDPSAGNVHLAALTLRPRISAHFAATFVRIQDHEEWGTEIFGPKDVMFKIIVVGNESRNTSLEQMAKCGFLWAAQAHFQDELFAVLTAQLFMRTKGSLVERAWKAIEKTYFHHPELIDISQKQYFRQAQLTLRAWKQREQTFRENSWPLETPAYITQLKELVPMPNSPAAPTSTASQTPAAAPLLQSFDGLQPGPMNVNPYTGYTSTYSGSSYMDPSSMDWDLLGDMMPGDGDTQFPGTIFGGFNNMSGVGGAPGI